MFVTILALSAPMMAATAAVSAAAGTGLSVMGARAQNKNVRRAMASASQATQAQNRQLVNQAALERLKRQREAAQIEARIRVAAGKGNAMTDTGTFAALLNQAQFDEAMNLAILDNNLETQLAISQAGGQATLTSLSGQGQNSTMAGIQGGLAGLNTGLSVANGVNNISKSQDQ